MSEKNLSIIVPTWNEEGNIALLLERIHKTLHPKSIIYEVIFIDDNSTDKTQEIIKWFLHQYPISLYIKVGKKGKAQSLLEGFSHAKFDLIAMIDADLQYPPEALTEMLEKIEKGVDIVVAHRKTHHTSFKRKLASKAFHFVFCKLLHGFSHDVQSGLKVFKKEIIERLTLNPSPWVFDLEFLVKARQAGYLIDIVNIVFTERNWGEAKIGLFQSAIEGAVSAVKLRLAEPQIIPFHPTLIKKKGNGFHYKGVEFVPHTNLHHSITALYRVSRGQIQIALFLALLFLLALLLNWHLTIVILLAVTIALYFIDLLLSLFIIYRSFSKTPEIQVPDTEIESVHDRAWPTYTIFCPLYKEWSVLPQFVTAISRLDYPKDKLQVMLLMEEDDKETIKHAKEYNLPSYFEIHVVPDSKPKTKPKAMNYGLQFARGEYVVIYDAEDIPDPKQLKQAVLAFKKAGNKTVCIQAKLNFYNPHQNLLTRIFTAEYSLWFDLVLTGLQSILAPIPLGGTSNHFKTENIRKLQGWDAFNVTEDCDLGMRLVKAGYKTAIVDSVTMEEANSDLKNWFYQRSRWIKGYMQTYLVHMRDIRTFKKNLKEPHIFLFQIIVGGVFASMLVNPLMWIITLAYIVFRHQIGLFIESFFPAPVLYTGVLCLIMGNFLSLYYFMIGCAKRGYDDLIKYIFLIPLYWIAMSGAAWIALYGLIKKPHFWAKTKHGLHLNNEKAINQASTVIGKSLVDKKLANYTISSAPILAN